MVQPQNGKSSTPVSEEDGDEYIVLPPDPEVLEEERRRLDAQVAQWEAKAAEDPFSDDDAWNNSTAFQWRFSLKDLLAAMAILAFAITFAKLLSLFTGVSVFILASLVWMQYRLVCAEREATRKRGEHPSPPAEPMEKPCWRDRVRAMCSYSTADMLIAVTVAAVVFTLLGWLGAALTTAILGMAVTVGILAYMLDFRPPRRWWMVVWIIVSFCYVAFAIATLIYRRFFA